ncbi:MAG: c-type cytochrome [Gemmatimonas sp.]|nr:c-type cytochrome [Gemmatimonas sp.]
MVTFAACGAADRPGEASAAVAAPALPERFGLGTPVDEARIAAWDVDIRPDGTGLPPGSGSVEDGAAVYLLRCAACHGPTGTEGPNNRLVGTEAWEDFPATRTVGNYWPFATTLYDYIVRAMPQDSPGTLSADETYAVIAWILHRNELIGADAVMDASTLPAVEMPARDRFVVDDRLESNVVR